MNCIHFDTVVDRRFCDNHVWALQGWPNAAPGAACGPCHKFGGPFTDQFRVYIRVRAACARSSSANSLYKAAHLRAQAAKEM